jgi:hypothetical protein
MKRVMQFAVITFVLILGSYYTYSIKKGKNDHIAPETKPDPSLSRLALPEEDRQAKRETDKDKGLQGKNKTNVIAKNEKETLHDNLTKDQISDEVVPVSPESENKIVPEDNFKQIENEVIAFITGWQVAWQNSAGEIGDMESYLAHYAKKFYADGVPKERWQQKKRKNNRKKRWISIQLRDLQVEEIAGNNNQVKVSFTQEYKSSNYADLSRKVLILRREGHNWLIFKENTIE